MNENGKPQILNAELGSRLPYAKTFNLLFWAFIVYLLIPVVGNVAIALASGRLRSLNKKALLTCIVAWLFVPLNALLCLATTSKPITRALAAELPRTAHSTSLFLLIFGAMLVLAIIMACMLCGVVADLARQLGATRLMKSALSRRTALAMSCIFWAVGAASMFYLPSQWVFFILVAMVYTSIMYFATIWVFSNAENLMKQSSDNGNPHVAEPPEGSDFQR
jgi:hypothetical protein